METYQQVPSEDQDYKEDCPCELEGETQESQSTGMVTVETLLGSETKNKLKIKVGLNIARIELYPLL